MFFVREPARGHTDGQRSSKGVRGKSGVKAYFMDVLYCIKKLVLLSGGSKYSSVPGLENHYSCVEVLDEGLRTMDATGVSSTLKLD